MPFNMGVSLGNIRRGWYWVRSRDYPPSTSLANQVKEGFHQKSILRSVLVFVSAAFTQCVQVSFCNPMLKGLKTMSAQRTGILQKNPITCRLEQRDETKQYRMQVCTPEDY